MTCLGSGQEKMRSDAEFQVAMERLLLIQRKTEQEIEEKRAKKCKEAAELLNFGDAERPGPDELQRREIADSMLDQDPIAGPEENKRRERVLQHIAGVLIRENQGRRAINVGNFVLDWNPLVTWNDVGNVERCCPSQKEMPKIQSAPMNRRFDFGIFLSNTHTDPDIT
jgi:hypothetical protein